MSGLRQIVGGLLALLLVGGALAASGLLATTEGGTPVAAGLGPSATVTLSPEPPTLAPTATRVPATATELPSPTASPTLTATFTPKPSETAVPPSETATTAPTETAIPTDTATFAPPPTQCIPAPPAGWTVYIIRPGDTLGNLAQRFGVSVGTLQRVNCIGNASDIRSGQRIYAPNVTPPTTAPTLTETPAEPTEEPTVPGDFPTITSEPIATATPDCVPPEFYDPFLGRCRLPDPTSESP